MSNEKNIGCGNCGRKGNSVFNLGKKAQMSLEFLVVFAAFISVLALFVSLESQVARKSSDSSNYEIARINANSLCLVADFVSRNGKGNSEIFLGEIAGVARKNSVSFKFRNSSATAECISGIRGGRGIEVEVEQRETA